MTGLDIVNQCLTIVWHQQGKLIAAKREASSPWAVMLEDVS